MKFSAVPFLLALTSPLALVSVSAQTDLTCPDEGTDLSTFLLPSGDDCILCVPTMDTCGVSCSCPTTECNAYSCELTPPGCGTVICSGEGVQIENPIEESEPGTPAVLPECSAFTNCEDCLDQEGCDAWSVGRCFTSCNAAPMDTSCWSVVSTGDNAKDVCKAAEDVEEDAEKCSGMMDCTSCVETKLSDKKNTCQWFGTDETDGNCAAGCGMDGCGVDTVYECPANLPEVEEPGAPVVLPECGDGCTGPDGVCKEIDDEWFLEDPDCGKCTCLEGGEVDCVDCPETPVVLPECEFDDCTGPDGVCHVPGDEWTLEDDCTQCVCADDGTAACVGCDEIPEPPVVLPDPTDLKTCEECIGEEAMGEYAWYPTLGEGGQCLEDCDQVEDTPCFTGAVYTSEQCDKIAEEVLGDDAGGTPSVLPECEFEACTGPDGMCYTIGDEWTLEDGCAKCTCVEGGEAECVDCPLEIQPVEPETLSVEQEGSNCEGIKAEVGCVLMDDEDTACEVYVPTTGEECNVEVKYTYYARQEAPPTDVILTSVIRTRDDSFHGSPRNFAENRWEENLTPTPMSYYQIDTWEGEFVNFCLKMIPNPTIFEFKTDVCTTTATYTLVPEAVSIEYTAPMSAEPKVASEGMTVEKFEGMDDTSSASGHSTVRFLSIVAVGGMFMMW